jgi:glycosyltransferase involved in cell wall biosynthesis
MISVIIPTYNDAQDLERTVLSVIAQDVVTEIVVIDDCSTEDVGLIDSLQQAYAFKLVRNQINYGLAGARNNGIHHAKYDLIFPLDTGDYLYDGGLDVLFNNIFNNDICYGNITDRYDIFHPKHRLSYPVKNITEEDFKKDNPLFCSSLFRKSIWKKAGGYTMRPHSFYEDYTFWCKCWSVGAKFKYVDFLVYHHANDGTSMLSELHEHTNEYKQMAQIGLEYGINKKCFKPNWK